MLPVINILEFGMDRGEKKPIKLRIEFKPIQAEWFGLVL